MKLKIIVTLFALFTLQSVFSQQVKSVDAVFAKIIPKRKLLNSTITSPDSNVVRIGGLNYIDTAYTIIVTIKTDSLQLNEKLILKAGPEKNNGTLINTKYKFTDHGVANKRCMHVDEISNVEIGEFKNGFIKIYFDIDASSFNNLNFLTVFRKIGDDESNKEHYEIK